MKIHSLLTAALLTTSQMSVAVEEIPTQMQEIMDQSRFQHAFWGIYVKDLDTEEVLYDLNSNKLFSPGSSTKLFTVAALLHAFGDNYRFNTPLYSTQSIRDGKLQGDLVIVGQGDLTMGGRQSDPNTISFTRLDHTYANDIPGVSLTPEDPLAAFNMAIN
jgi:serine-type D-Ala-D-Ala carboxypeptidase/endopeptidase (penicillin-binding protein 4)